MTVQNPAIFLQEGSHPAEDVRRALGSIVGQSGGLVGTGDLLVSEKAAGADMSVDVADGAVWIAGTEAAYQGVYFCENRGVTNMPISPADGANPRIDLVIARVHDSSYSGSADEWALDIVTGTPAAAPVAPSLPVNSFSLATVTVPAAAASISNSDITDTRNLTATTINGDLLVDGSVGVGTTSPEGSLSVDSSNRQWSVTNDTTDYVTTKAHEEDDASTLALHRQTATRHHFNVGNVTDAVIIDEIGNMTLNNSLVLNGVEAGVPIQFTPTFSGLTVGNGTMNAQYIRIGYFIHWEIEFIFGSTSAITGSVTIDYPISQPSTWRGAIGGQVWFEDTNGTDRMGYLHRNSASKATIHSINTTSTVAFGSAIGPTSPHTWAAGDRLVIQDQYLASVLP